MKMRLGFVSNSSSSAFIITNKTDKRLTLVDFVRENPQLIEEYVNAYRDGNAGDEYTQEKLLASAAQNDVVFEPHEHKYCVFGDESRTLVGCTFDYILRDGGSSESFNWRFNEALR